jgi:hypothetical protein
MRYTVYRIIVCSRTKIRMISSLRNLCVRILDADRFTIVVFQILDIKSNYLPGIVQLVPSTATFSNIGTTMCLTRVCLFIPSSFCFVVFVKNYTVAIARRAFSPFFSVACGGLLIPLLTVLRTAQVRVSAW